MNRKHRQTLETIFTRPDKKDVRWDDFLSLMYELGADVTERGGSMFGFRLNGHYAVFHRPHPGNIIYPSMLKRIRHYLDECGVNPEADLA